jgi:hypothetical protein
VLRRDREDRGHVGGLAVEMHRMIAAVRGVIAASMARGSIVSRAGSMSANTGCASVAMIASAL